jgi:superfamily II DNA or RNA helicase
MSQLLIENPSFVRLKDFSNPQLDLSKSILTFKDRSIEFLYKKHQKNFYWKQRDYESWESHLNVLRAARTRCCLFEDELGFYTYSGLASDISVALGGIEIVSAVSYPNANSIAYDQVPPPFRPYQEKIIEKLIEKKHGAVSVGTGLGKSLCIVGLCHYLGLRSLIMAPSRSIAVQLYDDFCKYFGAKKVGLYGDGKKQIGKLFTIGIAASLTRIEPGSKDWEWLSKCNVWLNDECHLTPATTFEKVAMGLCKEVPYRFFFSATHLRGDGADLVLKGITGDIVYNMDVTQGISEGWLARPSFKMITVKSESKYKSDDVQKMTRNHFYKNIDVYKKAAFLINNFVKLAKHQVLVLIDEICQFEYLYPLLEHECRFAHGQGATEMSKKIPSTFAKSNLKKLVNDFNAYEYPILIGTSCIGLGTDIKSVNTVIYLMGGKSETQIMQAVGRGTRKCKRLDGSEKTEFNFIDFAIRIKNDDFDDFDRNEGLMSPVFRHALCRQSYYNKIYPNSTKWM